LGFGNRSILGLSVRWRGVICSWRAAKLFSAIRGPGTGELANSLWDFHARFASAKFDQSRRNAHSTHAVQPEAVAAVKRTATT